MVVCVALTAPGLSCPRQIRASSPSVAQERAERTCVAMPVTPKTRIVSPAVESITPCTDWPRGAWTRDNTSFRGADLRACAAAGTCAWQQDMSFLGNIPSSHDFFFRIPKDGRLPHVTHVADDGFAVIHSHPPWMNGTKFFTVSSGSLSSPQFHSPP